MEEKVSRWFLPKADTIAYGDLVLLLTSDRKRYLITVKQGQRLHTHQGLYAHDDLVGRPLGDPVHSQLGEEALVLEPSLQDLIKHIKRGTQIIYPKDAAILVQRLNLRAGSRVIEAGTGSGGLTIALAWATAPTGCVYTYEARTDNHQLARRNLERVGLLDHVVMYDRAIDEGFEEEDVDALFLDVRDPWNHLAHVRTTLRSGGFFAALLPTTNQVITLLEALETHGFADTTVEEVSLRAYKPVPERLRPEDEMVAHTGFLIAARNIRADLDAEKWLSKERRRFLARKRAAQQYEERQRRRAARGQDDSSDESSGKYPRMPLPG